MSVLICIAIGVVLGLLLGAIIPAKTELTSNRQAKLFAMLSFVGLFVFFFVYGDGGEQDNLIESSFSSFLSSGEINAFKAAVKPSPWAYALSHSIIYCVFLCAPLAITFFKSHLDKLKNNESPA